MTLSTHKEKMRELLARDSEVINDSLWYVNPANIDQIISETLRFACEYVMPEEDKDWSSYRLQGIASIEVAKFREGFNACRSHVQEKFKELLTDTK